MGTLDRSSQPSGPPLRHHGSTRWDAGSRTPHHHVPGRRKRSPDASARRRLRRAHLRAVTTSFLIGCLILSVASSARASRTSPVVASPISQQPPSDGTDLATPRFQPSAPYYATFFYPWFGNMRTNGTWAESTWGDNVHTPPANWFSNYLPDPDPSRFDPSTELYSSTDDATLSWQLSKMAEAKQEVAISSWWGQGNKTDKALQHILGFMQRPVNPYPNLRWAIYYEKEGFGDPSVNEIASDLRYINDHLANQPAFFRIDNKPVIFVYGDPSDSQAMATRWARARAKAGVDVYLVLKVFHGYASAKDQPDSWHQYAPAVRADSQSGYYFMVSPGFWKDGEGVRLARKPEDFDRSVRNMVASPAQWKLTETWNEWGEGTAVEPGTQVIQKHSGRAVIDPKGIPFGNTYISILNGDLPALERGTGATLGGVPGERPLGPRGTADIRFQAESGLSLSVAMMEGSRRVMLIRHR